MRFHVQTDHKPLVPLFTSKPLDELPVRVQRFRLRMMRFDFSMSHVPGKSLLVADALSRAPCSEAEASEQETAAYVKSVIQSLPATDRQLERIQRHQEEDEECRQVAEYSRSGWPSRQALPGALRMYHWVATEISVQDGLLMRGSRIVIPASLRLECWIGSTGHLGITKCRGPRASETIRLVAWTLKAIGGAGEKLLRVPKNHSPEVRNPHSLYAARTPMATGCDRSF